MNIIILLSLLLYTAAISAAIDLHKSYITSTPVFARNNIIVNPQCSDRFLLTFLQFSLSINHVYMYTRHDIICKQTATPIIFQHSDGIKNTICYRHAAGNRAKLYNS